MTANMGTPGWPEGIQHRTNKAMLAKRLESCRRLQQGFWLLFKDCCGTCEGGLVAENVLANVTAVAQETDWGRFTPDILLYRGNKPPIWLEITHTSPPSQAKLAYCAKEGIDVFEIDGSGHPLSATVKKAHIALRNCRRRQRQRLCELWHRMERLEDPVVGIREDFRSPDQKRSDEEEFWSEFTGIRTAIDAGSLRCARCDDSFAFTVDGGFGGVVCLYSPTK